VRKEAMQFSNNLSNYMTK